MVPTVCVANATDVRLSAIDGTGTALPVPEREIAGLLAAFEATVSVAVRVPVADGVNVALSVQLAPGATVTAAPTHVPVGVKSVAFVPLLLIAVIVRVPAPVFVSVTLAGTGAVLLAATWVAPNASAVAEAEIAGAVAAAGFAIYAAMSAASVELTYPLSGPIFPTELMALMILAGSVPLRTLFMFVSGFGP